MKCGYLGWIIDATPEFSFGKFFAHARLARVSVDEDVDGEMRIERNLSWFDTAEEAIEVAQQWAFVWISDRNDSFAGSRSHPPTNLTGISAQTPAGRSAG